MQECLTNAARHAPGAVVMVRVHGSEEAGLHIRVANPLSIVGAASPGSGPGLVGLEERVQRLHGKMAVAEGG